jgi:hypothetical protein
MMMEWRDRIALCREARQKLEAAAVLACPSAREVVESAKAAFDRVLRSTRPLSPALLESAAELAYPFPEPRGSLCAYWAAQPLRMVAEESGDVLEAFASLSPRDMVAVVCEDGVRVPAHPLPDSDDPSYEKPVPYSPEDYAAKGKMYLNQQRRDAVDVQTLLRRKGIKSTVDPEGKDWLIRVPPQLGVGFGVVGRIGGAYGYEVGVDDGSNDPETSPSMTYDSLTLAKEIVRRMNQGRGFKSQDDAVRHKFYKQRKPIGESR